MQRLVRFGTLAAVCLVAACAQTPAAPSSSLPDKVIRNVPSQQLAKLPGKVPPVAAPDTAPGSELPLAPVQYSDVLDLIRGGMRLPIVQDPSVQVELDWFARNGDYVSRVFGRAQRYLYYIANEVQARGMPMELALLPVVESAFNPFAYSRSRAAGLWQFIPGTGTRFDLTQDWWQDQRRDVIESTRAALDYLSYLNQKFNGDWLLTIAAYNYGGGNVARAVQRNEALGRPTDFFSLSLPRETRAYVPKLLAISEVVRNPAAYGIDLPPIPNAPYFRVVDTGGPVDLRLAAGLAGIDVEELHALNAGWNQWVTGPKGPNRLLVPTVVADQFEQKLAALDPEQRAGLTEHKVESGDTLVGLAREYRVPVSFLQSVNDTDGSGLSAGDAVYVPGTDVDPLRPGLVKSASSMHVVRSGDTLWGISRRYNMSVSELMRVNGLSRHATLHPGQRLAVRPRDTDGAPLHLASSRHTTSQARQTTAQTRQIAYKVRRGDTLSSIARRFDVSVGDLQAWNGLDDSGIRAGQRLNIRIDASRDYGG